MWQTPTHMCTFGSQCELRRRIWSKHRTNISINNINTKVQSHSRSRCWGTCNTFKMLPSNFAVTVTRTTTTTTTMTTKSTTFMEGIDTTRRSQNQSRSGIRSRWRCRSRSFWPSYSKLNFLHFLLLLCTLCGKYRIHSEKIKVMLF